MNERDVLIAWRNIFQVEVVDKKALTKAEQLLDTLNGESPLHLRLAQELDELKKRQKPARKK